MAKMFGLPPAAAAAAPRDVYRNAIHPDDRERLIAVVERSLTTGENYETKYRITRPEGAVRWVIARGRIEHDKAGQAVRLLGAVVDITAQREAEDQLRESEARFRRLADVMPQIVWVTGPDGLNEYYNRRWYEYTGCTSEEGMGEQWSIFIHPEDQQRAIDRWNDCVRTGNPYEIEYRCRSKTEEYRWFLVRALPMRNEAGRIVQWFGTSTDIEDFKRAEEDRQNFVRLADNSTEFIAMCDLSGVPFYINPAGLEKLGIGSMAAARQINLGEDLFFPEDRDRIANEFLPAVLENGTGTTDLRFCHFETGETLWMVSNVTVLVDDKDRPIGFAMISQDITERRHLEENLRHLAADLSDAGRRKDEFLATLAHELRNPLAPMRNGLQIMRLAGNDTEAAERVRTMMERQLNQMVRLVDDLLDVSRISHGKVALRRERIELAPIIEQAVETSRPGIELARHQLTVGIPPQPVYLHADPVRLVQIFSNLLNNASKYSEPAGQIVVSAEQQQQQVAISVKDTGIGISAEMLPQVFGLFTQVHGALERASGGEAASETGGLGIGLTLVKQLVEMHGGTVSAFSEGLGQGSEFVIRLPVAAAPAGQLESTASKPTKTSARRILIVDDNEDSALSLAMLFEITGDETQTAHDGLAAIEAAADSRPDVVLLDIGLPGLNGYEAARAIREQPWGQNMILIALTGWGQPEDRRKSTEAGFDAHMVKPIDHDDLLQLLDELIE
ncbi:PAS domain-containing protein [Leptolyngbya sp. BC1307]|uniref:hybrid sensor histidine kinase/response regulator n=1 Tax=Leptolyngbya sp. BC1307 TaxID=2029589 RepID=UPI000EFAF929|nr:PAS domain-containing protein [Leptolyngbya sp. BC1307]